MRATIRLDKWLWQARFFKTRALAAEVAEGGHLRQEVPPMLAQACERHPGLRLERWPVMGASPEVLAALTAVYAGRWRAG